MSLPKRGRGEKMELMYLAVIASVAALLFAFGIAVRVIRCDRGEEEVRRISGIIGKAAGAFLRRQYTVVAVFFVIVSAILLVMNLCFGKGNIYTPFAFISGGFFSGLSGYIGMKIATASNGRTVVAARHSLNRGLRTAFSSGTVMGMSVVGLGLLDISVWYLLLKYAFGQSVEVIAANMLTFGIGASSVALFARVGGGIFTKAADVGADLCGKVEAGIPEDDIRNPAVIADNVGDNVGDVAGMGADLYESYVGSVLSCAALGVFAGYGESGFLLPFIIAAAGIFSSMIGSLFVRTGKSTEQRTLLRSLRTGLYVTSALMIVASFFIIKVMLGGGITSPRTLIPELFSGILDDPFVIRMWGAVLCGLVGGVLIGSVTEYFTSETYKPTRALSASAETGSATVIIEGLALGMRSTFGSVIIVIAMMVGSFILAGGQLSDIQPGLYGIGLASVGMLSTLGITLATDAYGPVADNAGGIAVMSGQAEVVRQRTDALDSLGNTTAATGKGFAIGSAALTAVTLIAAFRDTIAQQFKDFKFDLQLLNMQTLIGIFVGVMLPMLFSSVTMKAVGRAASSVVREVRRQFREIPGIMDKKNEPDYSRCIEICTASSQREMILPAVITVIAPVIVGALLGFNGIAGMLGGAAASGFMLAIMMSNSGGAWDNAKKYIESGKNGGKGSEQHKAAVVGDTVGDPFKDTAGPSINILIKLLSTVSIVFAPVIYELYLRLGLFG